MTGKSHRAKAALLCACVAGMLSGASLPAHATPALETVRIADGPYLDFVVFRVAKALGWDRELGLDLELTSSIKVPGEQLASGAIDVGDSSVTASFAFLRQVPQYRDFMIDDIFRGFTIVGHPGKQKTFQSYVDAGADSKTAKRQFILGEVKGKSICLYAAAYGSIISGLMSQADLTLNDVTIVDFADEALGANAFLRNQCDYFIGSLPQVLRLLSEFKDDAVAVAPQVVFGSAPNGILFFDTYAATADWLAGHAATAAKLWAIQLRFAQTVKTHPAVVIDQAVAAGKDLTGANLNSEAISLALSTYLTFPTIDEVRSSILKAGAPLDFYSNAEKLMADAKTIGTVPADDDVRTFQVEQQVFDKLQADADLVAWINKPL